MLEAAKERLQEAKNALARGDFEQGLVELSAAIELEPSIDAYLIRAEAHFARKDYNSALADVDKAEEVYDANPKSTSIDWEKIEEAKTRFLDAKNPDPGPPIRQRISVMLPISTIDPAEIFIKISKRRDISTDGKTLLRRHGSVIYDMEILDRNPVWADSIIELTKGTRAFFHAEQVANHAGFFHLQAPNLEFAQTTKNQYQVASELLHTLDPLMRAINAPVALIRNSNQVNACEEIFNCASEETSANVCAAYCKVYNDETNGFLFSVGMHSLGYPDAEIPHDLIPLEFVQEVLYEFLEYQVKNLTWNVVSSLQFTSSITNQTYLLGRFECDRFDPLKDARFNQFGTWVFAEPEAEQTGYDAVTIEQ